jgi:radical SAM superfamily enzyme YgiQ (UPF0313 family)
MTFQRRTAGRIVELIRSLLPEVRIVVGGYDQASQWKPIAGPLFQVDFVVRGEGEITFRELLRAIESECGFDHIAGLSYRSGRSGRSGDRFSHNPDRGVTGLESGEINLPNRGARVLDGYTMLGRTIDVIETSRGCTFDCSFCSIIEMRGRNFFTYAFDRVLEDIRDARNHGARAIFIVDDNILSTSSASPRSM